MLGRGRRTWPCLAAVASVVLAAVPVVAAKSPETQSRPAAKAKDPNERICETQKVLGSRLAVRRVCATRAEWAERRAQERDFLDRQQNQRCVVNPATGSCL